MFPYAHVCIRIYKHEHFTGWYEKTLLQTCRSNSIDFDLTPYILVLLFAISLYVRHYHNHLNA